MVTTAMVVRKRGKRKRKYLRQQLVRDEIEKESKVLYRTTTTTTNLVLLMRYVALLMSRAQ